MAFRPSSLVRVSGLLQADRGLAVALPEAERLAALQRRFAGVVPKAVALACRVAAIQGDAAHGVLRQRRRRQPGARPGQGRGPGPGPGRHARRRR
jgi:hypothetical protein